MILTFLGADTPLTKTLKSDGTWSNYPLVKNFTSYTEECHDIDDVFDALRVHAALGHCLLKGALNNPLDNEPRAGQTDSHTPTRLLVLDYDTEDNHKSIEEFLATCDTSLAETSHIIQRSCKAGFLPAHEHRCHVFFILNEDILPTNLKTWLTHINLTSFSNEIQLSENGAALRWPVDITVNQNDKLIYIAPPICAKDPIDERIILNTRKSPTFAIPNFNSSTNEGKKQALIKSLRDAQGFKKAIPRTKVLDNGSEIYTKIEGVQITGMRESTEFIHCNLNGGDSWGYWIGKDDPTYINNFKGEPLIKLTDVDPDLAKRLMGQRRQIQRQLRGGLRIAPFVGIDYNTDAFIKFEYDRDLNELIYFKTTTQEKCKKFMQEFGLDANQLSRWKVVFEPANDQVINPQKQWVNTFKMTDLLKAEPGVTEIPPTTKFVIEHLCNYHEETINELLNWLSWIYQNRRRSQTAWIFQGCPGTGKGILKDDIIRPIFDPYTYTVLLDSLTKEFNYHFQNRMFLFIDEADFETITRPENLMARIKSAITDPKLSIRKMQTDFYEVDNFLNVMLFSNELIPIAIGHQDRRFNVAPRQDTPIKKVRPDWGQKDIDEIHRESADFASFLAGFKCFREPNIPFESDARSTLADISRSSVELYAAAIRDGDAAFFAQYLNSTPQIDPAYWQYAATVEEIIDHAIENQSNPYPHKYPIPVTALRHMYNYVQGQDISPNKFGRLLSAKGIRSHPFMHNGAMTRCVAIAWQGDVAMYKSITKNTVKNAIESFKASI